MPNYCTECGTKVTPSMKYCPECGKKISKKSQNKSKKKEPNKNKNESSKNKTKSTNKKTNSKKKKSTKNNKRKIRHKLRLGLVLLVIGVLLVFICFTIVIPNMSSNEVVNNTGLLKIESNSIEELTNDDIASKEGYFCRIISDNGIYYIKQSEIKSLNGLDKPFLAKIMLKQLSNGQEIYVIYEVYDLEGNKL